MLLLNTAARRSKADVTNLPRRHWEDTCLAVGRYLGAPGARKAELQTPEGSALYTWMRKRLIRTTLNAGVRPWEFLATVRGGALPRDTVLAPRPSDDTGRAMLASLGFAAIGGVSPFLVFWVGPLFMIPLFIWVTLELSWAGRSLAAGLFVGLVAVSAYVVDVLSLSYSAAGFSTASLLLAVALAVYALLHPAPAVPGLLVRALLAGVFWAVCILCRSGAILSGIGLGLALVAGAWRVATTMRRFAVIFPGALVLLVLPFALVRPTSHHEAWLGVWEGLGDFDRTKGHTFADPEARKVLAAGGIVIPRTLPLNVRAAETEPFFRELVLRSIGEDPLWYGRILAKRVAATVTQVKLMPSRFASGSTFAARSHPQQGATDVYYSMTATADVFAVGHYQAEAPLWLLWLPLFALTLAGCGAGGRFHEARRELGVVAILAVAALAQPVLVTTAGGLETQGFVLVYLLAAGFLGARMMQSAGLRSFPR